MRRVDRLGVPVPLSLQSTRVRDARRAVEEILILPDVERRQRRSPYAPDYVQAPDVRNSLREVFANKCAYCESDLTTGSSENVDHFRPVRVGHERSELQREHYYSWLAYEWGNLYLVCSHCNISKGNQFPVKGSRAPLLSSLDEVRRLERPHLLDPCHDDPDRHLNFYWNGEVRGWTERGVTTVEILRLNRDELVEKRSTAFHDMLGFLEEDVATACQLYQEGGPYSGALEGLLRGIIDDLADRLGRESDSRAPVLDQLMEFAGEASSEELRTVFAVARNSAPREPSNDSARSAVAYPREPSGAPGRQLPPAGDRAPSEISIKGYKAIRDLTFTMPDRRSRHGGESCLMLIGENACGKSSVLEAIALTLAGTNIASQVVPAPSDLLRRKGKQSWALFDAEPVEIKVRFYGIDRAFSINVDPVRLVFEGESDPAAFVLAYGPRRFFLNSKSRKVGQGIRGLFDPATSIRDPADWLRSLSDRVFFPLARALREILNLHKEDSLVRDESLGVCVAINGQRIPIERMSEGYKSLFALAVDIMRQLLRHWRNLEEARAIVLIDEIETHLHPRWKMRVMSGFRRALPMVTFIATTHDPLCLRGMDDGEVHVLMRNLDQEIEQLIDLPSLKGMRADQILTSDYFGLSSTADPETEAVLAGYAFGSSVGDELKQVRNYLSQTLIGTDSAALMLAEEAIKKYLDAREQSDAVLISETKKGAIQQIISSLDRISRGKQ